MTEPNKFDDIEPVEIITDLDSLSAERTRNHRTNPYDSYAVKGRNGKAERIRKHRERVANEEQSYIQQSTLSLWVDFSWDAM